MQKWILMNIMWAQVLDFNKGVFTCIFSDSAYNISNVKRGDTIFIKKADVEDWIIFDYYNQTKSGHFSEKFLKGE